jgi:hypothetical protein
MRVASSATALRRAVPRSHHHLSRTALAPFSASSNSDTEATSRAIVGLVFGGEFLVQITAMDDVLSFALSLAREVYQRINICERMC